MKRILFKSGTAEFGGVERVQAEYVNYLQSINADFRMVLEKDLAEKDVMINLLKCPVFYLKNHNELVEFANAKANKNKSFLHKIKYNFAIMKDRKLTKTRFSKIVNELKPEIAINFHFHDSLYFNLDVLKNVKNIVWIHLSIINQWKNLEDRLKYIKKISKYDLIVCVSKGIIDEIIELAPELKDKTTYIYNPINFERIEKLSNEEFTNDEVDLTNEKFLLMVSRIDALQKDHRTLIEAYNLAKEKGYDGKLYIIGDGENKGTVEALINNSKYKNEIKLLGSKINPFNWMKKCDKFILSSRLEGLGLVLIEALTVNDTVISSDCPSGPSEVLEDGKIGYLFEVGNAEQLAELMLEAKPKNRNLIDDSLQRFDKKNIMQEFEEIIV